MEIGDRHAGQTFKDFLGQHSIEVTIDTDGWGDFPVGAGTVAVWINKGFL